MALFNRRKNESVMPDEVRDYYKTERRERTGVAWLLAITTLLVTFLIAAGLFFGGRLVYRAIFDNNESTTSQDTTDNANSDSGQVYRGEGATTDEPSVDTPVSSSETTSNNSTTSSGPTSNTSTTNQSTSLSNTGPSELVNTGPGDEL